MVERPAREGAGSIPAGPRDRSSEQMSAPPLVTWLAHDAAARCERGGMADAPDLESGPKRVQVQVLPLVVNATNAGETTCCGFESRQLQSSFDACGERKLPRRSGLLREAGPCPAEAMRQTAPGQAMTCGAVAQMAEQRFANRCRRSLGRAARRMPDRTTLVKPARASWFKSSRSARTFAKQSCRTRHLAFR